MHFGPGAFHRVHQACYIDDVLHTDPRWGICEVSLHSTGVRDALVPQDGLYTIAILDEQSSFRVIGSVKEVLVAPESPSAVLDRMVAPTTYIVSATITEKGYCLNKEGGLDFSHPDIASRLEASRSAEDVRGIPCPRLAPAPRPGSRAVQRHQLRQPRGQRPSIATRRVGICSLATIRASPRGSRRK